MSKFSVVRDFTRTDIGKTQRTLIAVADNEDLALQVCLDWNLTDDNEDHLYSVIPSRSCDL